jgi:transposase-like protein
MTGRPQYAEAVRAQVYVLLAANDGNVKRTAKEMHIPPSTVRKWRDDWEQGINIPSVDEIQASSGEFVEEATRVRNLALIELERKIPTATAATLANVIGTLDDRISRAKGVADKITEHKITLPSREEIIEALASLQQQAIDAAISREQEIVEAEVVELRALPTKTASRA